MTIAAEQIFPEKSDKSEAVIVLSGGLDSGVLLDRAQAWFKKTSALSFRYGAKHNESELQCASQLCEKYGLEHHIVDLGFYEKLMRSSSLLQSGPEVPEGVYAEDNMRSTVVPFRNGVMLSIAIAFAEERESGFVLLGSHSGDHAVYPDCRPEFNRAISDAASYGTYTGVRVLAPFAKFLKSEIAALGRYNGFDFSQTWTCYKGGAKHCGACAACNERKQALNYSSGEDPTEYL